MQKTESWTENVDSWTANHFTIAESGGNVALLLRRVANAVSRLDNVDILDLTFCAEDQTDACRITVYFAPTDKA